MTTPHTPPAALLDVAAIEARAAAATCPRCHGRGTVYDSTPAGYLVERQCVACLGAGRPSSDVLALLAALRTLDAQRAGEAAAVDAAARSTREACAAQLRARAECLRRYAYEATAKADAAEYAHDAREVDACAAIVASVALAAPEAAVDVVALVPRVEGAEADAAYLTHAANTAPDLARQVLSLAAALRTERAAREAAEAQHAADVAAAVAGERERAVAVCRAVADGWERASTTAKVDTGLALIRAEGATECADAIAAPTGGRE